MKFIRDEKKELWQKITDTRQLDDAAAADLDQAIGEFQKRYAGAKETVTV